ncbi:LGFP repeat-containing protein, partial [Corynebacterium glutamicum]|nr:LGFP repeat-containing protein [Corynebacterium glutamicum]
MRSDVIELPEGVSKEKADQLEVAEARLNEGARLMATTGCEVMWPTGFSVCGRILDTYRQVGGQLSWLGPPKSNELTNPDGVGKRSEFFGGAIYWHPDTGAYAVTLDGLRQWGTLNWESGPLGYPTSGPMDTNYPLTQRQTFQGGDNYYNPLTGGAVWGDIKQRYEELGGSNHAIG